MTVVIGSGFVAEEFSKWGFPIIGRDQFEWDGRNPDFYKLKKLLSPYEYVINTIAATDTKYCQTNPDYAIDLNINFIKFLNNVCDSNESKLIQISTGCVYEPCPYTEEYLEDDPISVYTLTKALGEQLINCNKNIIIRPRLIFGPTPHKNNLFDKIKNYSKFLTGKQSVSSTSTIVEATINLISKNAVGVFNVVQSGAISIMEIAEIMGLKIDGPLIKEELRSKKSLTSPEIVLSSTRLHEYYVPNSAIEEVGICYSKWCSLS